MSILKNAVDSIAVGLEDYSSPDERRIISCTRNIFAGILLLFKYKLELLSSPGSDKALIKQRVLPAIDADGNLIWVGKGNKTVDVINIKQRFGSLGIEVDWKRITKINDFRNEIEHYYSSLSHEAVRSIVADTFVIIRDFIANHLSEDPKTVLGEQSWATLIEVSEVYEKEKTECEEAIERLGYFNDEIMNAFKAYSCNECGSSLIIPINNEGEACESEFVCKSCENKLPYESIVNLAIAEYYGHRVYLSYTDGDDTPTVDCPSCFDGTYLYEEQICSSCGYSAEHTCQRCGSPIIPSELTDSPFCGYCTYMMQKDD